MIAGYWLVVVDAPRMAWRNRLLIVGGVLRAGFTSSRRGRISPRYLTKISAAGSFWASGAGTCIKYLSLAGVSSHPGSLLIVRLARQIAARLDLASVALLVTEQGCVVVQVREVVSRLTRQGWLLANQRRIAGVFGVVGGLAILAERRSAC